MTYLAKWKDGCVFLSRDEQMEGFLEKGACIYSSCNGEETLIATPEDGFLVERPTFPVATVAEFPSADNYEIARKILTRMED